VPRSSHRWVVRAGVPLDNAHAYMGVGESSTAFAPSQTDLQASANKVRRPMDGALPYLSSSQTIAFSAMFAKTKANFTRREWGLCTSWSRKD
jgi:hypothetical protein